MALNEYSKSIEYFSKRTTDNFIAAYFPWADLRCRHAGLKEYAKKKAKIDADALRPGEFLIFSNRLNNKFGILGPCNFLIFINSTNSKVVDIETLTLIPTLISGKKFNWKSAAKLGFKKAA